MKLNLCQLGMQPYFFGGSAMPLFGCLYPPRTEFRRRHGIVICYPTFGDYTRTHRACKQLAIRLSNAGFPTLRFDYWSCGDSGGDELPASLQTWMSNIGAAREELVANYSPNRICLIGLGLGGTLAMAAAAQSEKVETLILWDPVLSGREYLQELSAQHQTYISTNNLVDEPFANAGTAELSGFSIPESMVTEIDELDITSVKRKAANRVLIFDNSLEPSSDKLIPYLERLDTLVEYRHIPDQTKNNYDNQIERVSMEVIQSIVSRMTEVDNE